MSSELPRTGYDVQNITAAMTAGVRHFYDHHDNSEPTS